MKRIFSAIIVLIMLLATLPIYGYNPNYTEIDIGTEFASHQHNFFGGIGQIWLKSNDVSKPRLIDKQGNTLAEYSNGLIFLDSKHDGNYYAHFSSYNTTDGRDEIIFGNAISGKAPSVMTDIIGLEQYSEPIYPNIKGADYTVLQAKSEYPFLKYLYDNEGNRVFDKPISSLIDRGSIWLEAIIEEDGSSIFINREDFSSATAPAGRYKSSCGVGAKLIRKEGTFSEYGVYDEDENLIFTYTSNDYITPVSEMIWKDGYCIVKKSGKYSNIYYGIIDTKGNIVLPLEYAGLDYPDNGIIRAAKYGTGLDADSIYFGLIDINGNELCDFKYGYITPFKNGIAAFRSLYYRDRGGYIDTNGNEIVSECVYYPNANTLGEYNVYVGTDRMDNNNDKVLYNKNGSRLTSRAYAHIGPFSEGLALACIGLEDDRYMVGYIDTNGNEVIPCIYDDSTLPLGFGTQGGPLFTNGATILTKNGHGYIIHNPLMTHGIKVTKSTATINVNGNIVRVDAYNIGGNNYFKLRDIAALIDGSEKQFNVVWNEKKKSVEIETNSPYVKVGGELANQQKLENTAKLSMPIVYCDGVMINEFDYDTCQQTAGLKAYNIGGNNYFKLRDIGDFIDFYIGWDSVNGIISIDTSLPYTE